MVFLAIPPFPKFLQPFGVFEAAAEKSALHRGKSATTSSCGLFLVSAWSHGAVSALGKAPVLPTPSSGINRYHSPSTDIAEGFSPLDWQASPVVWSAPWASRSASLSLQPATGVCETHRRKETNPGAYLDLRSR
jgi:hypothetical protein